MNTKMKIGISLGASFLLVFTMMAAFFGAAAIGGFEDIELAPVRATGTLGNWSGEYSDAMNATENVCVLLGDLNTLTTGYIGTFVSIAITLFLVGALVFVPVGAGLMVVSKGIGYAKRGF